MFFQFFLLSLNLSDWFASLVRDCSFSVIKQSFEFVFCSITLSHIALRSRIPIFNCRLQYSSSLAYFLNSHCVQLRTTFPWCSTIHTVKCVFIIDVDVKWRGSRNCLFINALLCHGLIGPLPLLTKSGLVISKLDVFWIFHSDRQHSFENVFW